VNLNFSDRAEINRHMRAILVKNWIDIGRITFHVSTNGIIAVNGSLHKLPGTGELTPQIVGEMFDEIGNISKVMRVDAEFDNWSRSGYAGIWKHLEKTGRQVDAAASGAPAPQVIKIKVTKDGNVVD
jgi:hypothetical protein